MTMNEDKNAKAPTWLKELQQRSWEPEILLSGIVLYGMLKVPKLLDRFEFFFRANVFGNSNDASNLVGLSKMGIYWLITGLILHLICRGIWIGMVGLSYTFPKGINSEKITYRGNFKNKISKIPSYESIVIKLEKISSSLFSVSFMLFMCLIGGYLFFLILVIIPFTAAYVYFDMDFQGTWFDVFQYYVLVIFIISILGLIDFLSLGYFRRFNVIARIYWPFHTFISSLTLSRFYRPIYYGMVSNFNKWVFFLFLLAFTLVSVVGASTIANTNYAGESYSRLSLWNNKKGYNAYVGYYDNQNGEQYSAQAHIQSDIISGNVIKLFIPANISYEDEMLEKMSLDSLKKIYPDTTLQALNMMVVKNFYLIEIDKKMVGIERWYTHYKKRTSQFGYLTYINISEIEEGLHHISVRGNDEKFVLFADIPFYREVAPLPYQALKNSQSKEKEIDFQPKPFGIRE